MSERPLECSQCKKNPNVVYKEMVGSNVATTHLCQDCPILKQKLKGEETLGNSLQKKEEGLFCTHCKTSLEAILMGKPLGCKECYSIFQEALIKEMIEIPLVSPKLKLNPAMPTSTLHIGKTPLTDKNAENIARICDLNEALNEALRKENYEEAAWLRDQIDSLTKACDDS